MQTSTIGLFDRHIKKAKLYGLQTHFHAPSEHTIDGKLMDLEMHVVHALEPELVGKDRSKSQFTNGVLGFLFKAVKDDYFERENEDDYHDRFLNAMLNEESTKLDLTAFVNKLRYNRRWSYQGSLTTNPFVEGILWNVVQQVIHIRQSTLDKFLQYRRIQQHHIIAPFPNAAAKEAAEELRA